MPSIQGFAYPLEFDPGTGGLKIAYDAELIRCHVLSYLETEPLERVMRPDYGTPAYLFTTQTHWQGVAAQIETRLSANIPQAKFVVNGRLTDDGEAELEVFYEVPGFEQQESVKVIYG